MLRILVVDDESKVTKLWGDALRDAGHEIHAVNSGREAITFLGREGFDLVVTDLRMAPPDGLEVLRAARKLPGRPEVVLVTGYDTTETAVRAMKDGARDYLTKPVRLDELCLLAARIDEERKLHAEREALLEENRELRDTLGGHFRFDALVGKGPRLASAVELARKVAQTDATVLIRGESGTGKDVLARAIHQSSPRRKGPFVKVNCGALPEALLESELFGHEKGAFTGAVRKKPGRFVSADGGTVFLDEIGEVPPAVQVKLLQVIEEKTFHPLGSDETLTSDVRILAATNRDLEAMVKEGKFREDLFYRLNVFPITLPSLRERREDLPLLLGHFLSRNGRKLEDVKPDALEALLEHDYPGNVREMENLVARAVILAGTEPIRAEHLPGLRGALEPAPGDGVRKTYSTEIPDEGISLEDLERDLIRKALAKAGGNKTEAARLLGLTRRTLYSRMEKHGIPLG